MLMLMLIMIKMLMTMLMILLMKITFTSSLLVAVISSLPTMLIAYCHPCPLSCDIIIIIIWPHNHHHMTSYDIIWHHLAYLRWTPEGLVGRWGQPPGSQSGPNILEPFNNILEPFNNILEPFNHMLEPNILEPFNCILQYYIGTF